MIERLKKWWRGWDEDDLKSLTVKLIKPDPKPGEYIAITARELRALREYNRRRGRFA
jgi:hypothetical protein